MLSWRFGYWVLKVIFLFRGLSILIIKGIVNIRTLVHDNSIIVLVFRCLFLLFTVYWRHWCRYLGLNSWNDKWFISVHKINCFVSFVLVILCKPRIVIILCYSSFIELFIFSFFMTPEVVCNFNLFWLILLKIFCHCWNLFLKNWFLLLFFFTRKNTFYSLLILLRSLGAVTSHRSCCKSLLRHNSSLLR